MATIFFWEKPGCGGNARQKALLAASGHTVVARNLLAEPWTSERLRAFFGARPVAEWFNRAAPRVNPGEVWPETLYEQAALALMLQDKLLIRRPLIQVGERCEAGFYMALMADWIGLRMAGGEVVDDDCRRHPAAVALRVTETAERKPRRQRDVNRVLFSSPGDARADFAALNRIVDIRQLHRPSQEQAPTPNLASTPPRQFSSHRLARGESRRSSSRSIRRRASSFGSRVIEVID